jgi:hypothetical protein
MRLLLAHVAVVLGFLASVVSAVLLAAVLLLDCTGCGPTRQPQPSIAERCKGEPICMLIGQQVEADEAAQQPVYAPEPSHGRQFIYGWPRVGGRVNSAPIGYVDY